MCACVRACVRARAPVCLFVCADENVLCLDIIRTADLALNTNNQAIADASERAFCMAEYRKANSSARQGEGSPETQGSLVSSRPEAALT